MIGYIITCLGKGVNIIESLARVFKLLGDSSRLQIIFCMEKGPCSVSQIIECTGLSQPLVSFHLKVLREANLVKTERKATFVYNSLCDEELPRLIHQFKKYGIFGEDETIGEGIGIEMPFPCPRPPWMKR